MKGHGQGGHGQGGPTQVESTGHPKLLRYIKASFWCWHQLEGLVENEGILLAV